MELVYQNYVLGKFGAQVLITIFCSVNFPNKLLLTKYKMFLKPVMGYHIRHQDGYGGKSYTLVKINL